MPKPRDPAQELIIEKPYAHTIITDHNDKASCIRIYGDSPETCTFQIRTIGKTTGTRKGVVKRAFSSVGLDVYDIDRIIDRLKDERKRILRATELRAKAQAEMREAQGSQGNKSEV